MVQIVSAVNKDLTKEELIKRMREAKGLSS